MVDAFTQFWSLGYRSLIPIIPPGVRISERSTLHKRLLAGRDDRGKTPGIKWADGSWSSFDWNSYVTSERDFDRWNAMGAGVGIKTGDLGDGTSLVLIDADTLDEGRAAIIQQQADAILGERLPVRVGRYPKAGYLARVQGDFTYSRIEFGERDEKGNLRERVEILSDGKQFVAAGMHPVTGKPYWWPRGVPALADAPLVAAEALTAFLQALRPLLPAATLVIEEGGGNDVSQASLRADPGVVAAAVEALPNGTAFTSRNDWLALGYAIKGALGLDHDAEGLDLYKDFSARWTDAPADWSYDDEIVEAEWQRMKPPFKVGAQALFKLAEAHSDGAWTRADAYWTDPTNAAGEPLFPDQAPPRKAIKATQFAIRDPSLIPTRKFLYGRHYVRKFVSTTMAPSGVGKSSLSIVEALAMVSAKPLLGITPADRLRVWLYNGEDPFDEQERRIVGATINHGLEASDVGDRLFVDSGRDMEIVIATETRSGTVISQPVVDDVIATLKANRIDVLVVDPFVSSHRVTENDNGAIDLVTKQWAKIADACDCSIELVHHMRKLNGGEGSIEDGRGAGAMVATVRSARALVKMTKAEGLKLGCEPMHRRLFRFGEGKTNLAPPADDTTVWFELHSVPLGNGEGATPIDALMKGDQVGVVRLWDAPAAAEAGAGLAGSETAAVFEAIRGGEWRKDIRAGDAWIGVPISRVLRLDRDDPDDLARVKQMLKGWLASGALREVSRKDDKRMARVYVEVVADDAVAPVSGGEAAPAPLSLFD